MARAARHAILTLALLASVSSTSVPPPASEPTGAEEARTLPETIRNAVERLIREDRPDRAARRFMARRQPQPGTSTDLIARYRAAQAQRDRMPRYASRHGTLLDPNAKLVANGLAANALEAKALGTWEPLGPGNVGGRTRAILIDPDTPSVMYAGGVSGGIWKSTNSGQRWRPLVDLLPNISVSAMAMDPGNSRVIYAGTGEGFFREVVRQTALPLRGEGILKTTDAGATWSRLGATANANFYWVNDLAVSANNPRVVYAATRAGVFRSRNGGSGWRRVLDPQVTGGCMDLALRTDRPTDELLASCGTFEQATVYFNPGAEGTSEWTVSLRDPGMARTSLAIAPSNQNIVYALAAGPGGNSNSGLHGLFRSSQGGAPGSWQDQLRPGDHPVGSLLLTNAVIDNLGFCGFDGTDQTFTFGWYTNVIAVDPVNPNRLFAGGIDLFRSSDAGRSWAPINYWWIGGGPQNSHADMHAVVFHPRYNGTSNRRMFIGNDGGVFETANARAPASTSVQAICNPESSAVVWTSRNRDYGVTQFYHGAPVPPDGVRALGGTQDNGTVIGASVNGWQRILGGDGGYVAIDPRNANVIYAESQNLGLQKSTDGGATFTPATSGIAETTGAPDEDDNDVLFITPFLLDPTNPDRLWTGGRRVWRTGNGAASWTQASPVLSTVGRVSALAVSPVDPDRMLVGRSDGTIHRQNAARTAGSTSAWPEARPRGGYVSWIAFDPLDPDLAYATYAGFGGRHVWRTRDAGATWQAIDGSGATRVPDIPVHSIVVDPGAPRRLYLGTDLGVLVSLDGGSRWAAEQTGFPNAVTESLALLVRPSGTRFLYAFTHGRGAWRVRLDASDGGGGGSCTLAAGNGRFCTDCGLCGEGEGDCDNDAECAPGLACVDNIGAQFGFAPGVDVCTASGGGGGGSCPLSAGNGRFCTDCGPCGEGEGDCDNDAECAPGLACVDNIGAQFGFAPGVDVCTASSGGGTCTAANPGAGNFCDVCGPCASGQGDCDRDSDCQTGLTCVDNVGAQFGFAPGVDVCL